MIVKKTTFDSIKKYRADYLNTLPEFQELFIELMIKDSDYYMIQLDDKNIGYIIITANDILIEFYVMNKHICSNNEIFRQVVKDLCVAEIYCKSFDSLLLSSCLLGSFPYSVDGVLYRDYAGPLVVPDSGIKMKKANLLSVGLLINQDDSINELFETREQLTGFIENENVFEFYKNDKFVGCGMVIRTHPEYNFCDLGVWVSPLERGNALGAQIILNLREFAVKSKMKPSCGCAVENLASQKTIEKSGFISRYKMINFRTR